jgi:GTP cyclohydrolase I
MEDSVMAGVRRSTGLRLSDEAVEGALGETERVTMIAAAAEHLRNLFDTLRLDHQNDHNLRGTPQRVARMLVDELLRGKHNDPPELTSFDNVEAFDELIVTGPIDVRSTCAHHMMPIFGEAFIGVLPATTGKIIGLSKYDRIVDHFCGRPQMQEELVRQIGQFIMDHTAPRGVAVRISAVHTCKTHRGVRSSYRSRMVTSAYFGALADDQSRKQEFLRECDGLQRLP